MSKLRLAFVVTVVAVVVLVLTSYSISSAATYYGEQTFTDNTFYEGVVNFFKKGVRIGQQGYGGVTYFNGSMANSTTTNGKDNPLTLADNVRIDGAIYRTEEGGSNSLKFADSVIPTKNDAYSLGTSAAKFKHGFFSGTLTADAISVGSFSGSGVITSDSLADGSVSNAKLADNAVTSDKISAGTITGSDISSSAALAVSTVTSTGNGAIKGWAYCDPDDGALFRGYNVLSSSRVGTGEYEVRFNFDVSQRVYIATPSGVSGLTAVRMIGASLKNGSTDTVNVRAYNDAGTLANSTFMLAVF